MRLIRNLLNLLKRLVETIMKLPLLQPGNTSRVTTDVFRGYNHNLKIADGEMYDMNKITADFFPMLARRKPRMFRNTTTNPDDLSALLGGDQLIWVDNDQLYVDGEPTGMGLGQSRSYRDLVRFGHYVISVQDRRYYNLSNPGDAGSIDAAYHLSSGSGGAGVNQIVHYEPCNIDGDPYTITYTGSTEPEEPTGGQYWLKVTSKVTELYQYDAVTTTWVKVESVYMLVVFETSGVLSQRFSEGDTVEIHGLYYADLNGSKYIYKIGGDPSQSVQDHLVLIGLDAPIEHTYDGVDISRTMPDMDFVIECQNRLWGCAYTRDEQTGEMINEIYCSKLGDFKNWRVYQGLSTDSWAASVGAPGEWTGAISYLGKPVFFKEDRIYQVTVSPQGAHRIDETPCRGVEKGSARSLCVVGETLYYKSMGDVMAWQGGFPVSVSGSVFGGERWKDGVAGGYGTKYYLCMRDAANDKRLVLFYYDTARNLWIKDDDWTTEEKTEPFAFFATVRDEIWGYLIGIPQYSRMLAAMTGNTTGEDYYSEGIRGSGPLYLIPWSVETGIMYYESPDHKYVSRYNIRLWMEAGTSIHVWLEYDSSGEWVMSGVIHRPANGIGTVTVPIRPRRCDHLRMKLEGSGDFKIFSIERVLEVGSDV